MDKMYPSLLSMVGKTVRWCVQKTHIDAFSADREYIFHSRDHFHTAMCIRIPAIPCVCAIYDTRCGDLAVKHFLTDTSNTLANCLYRWLPFYGRQINTYSKWMGITSASHLYRDKLDVSYLLSNALRSNHKTAVICINWFPFICCMYWSVCM
jgi:hypothetical protein